MPRTTRPFAAAALAATLVLGGVACSDEDGDGATTDEEVGELDQNIDEGTDQVEEEVEEGEDELEGDDG